MFDKELNERLNELRLRPRDTEWINLPDVMPLEYVIPKGFADVLALKFGIGPQNLVVRHAFSDHSHDSSHRDSQAADTRTPPIRPAFTVIRVSFMVASFFMPILDCEPPNDGLPCLNRNFVSVSRHISS